MTLVKKNTEFYFIMKKIKMKILSSYIGSMSSIQLEKYIGKLYKKYTGYSMNWDNPKMFTEKIQWEKVHGDLSQRAIFTDKYVVREWVKTSMI